MICKCMGRCGVVDSTLAFGSTRRGFESRTRYLAEITGIVLTGHEPVRCLL